MLKYIHTDKRQPNTQTDTYQCKNSRGNRKNKQVEMRPLNLSACENGPSWDVINNFTTYSYNHSYTDNKFSITVPQHCQAER